MYDTPTVMPYSFLVKTKKRNLITSARLLSITSGWVRYFPHKTLSLYIGKLLQKENLSKSMSENLVFANMLWYSPVQAKIIFVLALTFCKLDFTQIFSFRKGDTQIMYLIRKIMQMVKEFYQRWIPYLYLARKWNSMPWNLRFVFLAVIYTLLLSIFIAYDSYISSDYYLSQVELNVSKIRIFHLVTTFLLYRWVLE